MKKIVSIFIIFLSIAPIMAKDIYKINDFTLTNQDGKTISKKDLQGREVMFYFGYTSCPDVCPTALLHISQELQKYNAKILVYFVSVDHEHDTPAVLKEYLSNFHPQIQGLTGRPEEIKKLADGMNATYKKILLPDSYLGYVYDHSNYYYLFNNRGKFINRTKEGNEFCQSFPSIQHKNHIKP